MGFLAAHSKSTIVQVFYSEPFPCGRHGSSGEIDTFSRYRNYFVGYRPFLLLFIFIYFSILEMSGLTCSPNGLFLLSVSPKRKRTEEGVLFLLLFFSSSLLHFLSFSFSLSLSLSLFEFVFFCFFSHFERTKCKSFEKIRKLEIGKRKRIAIERVGNSLHSNANTQIVNRKKREIGPR